MVPLLGLKEPFISTPISGLTDPTWLSLHPSAAGRSHWANAPIDARTSPVVPEKPLDYIGIN